VYFEERKRAMANKPPSLTSTEFASRTGLSVQTIGRLIREGKIKAKKQSGKWAIDPEELHAKAVAELAKGVGPAKASPKTGQPKAMEAATNAPAKSVPAAAAESASYSVSEFSAMTYLTEYGVELYLKKGVLTGHQDKKRNWRVDAANLQNPGIRHLVR
jgi:excisionase family DNA binding protein